MNWIEIVFGVFAAIFALLFLAVGAMALVGGVQQKKRCSGSAQGVVSAVRAEAREKGRRRFTVYTPEFRFEAGGHTYTMKAHFSSLKREFREGQTVAIRFDPADPKTAYVADDTSNSAQGGVMCVCFGLVLAVAAVVLFT